jgi:hypothetical protein
MAYSSSLHLPEHHDSGLDSGGSDQGSPPRTENNAVIEPLVVDTLANNFKLDQQQRANLHAFVKARNLTAASKEIP